MSEDQFSEVIHTSWGERIKTSLKGIIFGLILFLIAFPLLFWNEGRAVKRYQTLKEGEGAVISVAADRVDPANQGRLVHLSATADTGETLIDDAFKVSEKALRLKRTAEMYQWKEERETHTEKKAGGGEKTVTRYSYTKVWSTSVIQSSGFKQRSGHENPTSMPFSSKTFDAAKVTVGAFVLDPAQVREIDNWRSVAIDASVAVPSVLGAKGAVYDNGFYRGNSPGDPDIGDVRVSFKAVYPGPVSLVAVQQGSSFRPYTSKGGGTISLLQTGNHSAMDMFKTAHFHNRLLTWGLRIGGLLLMFIGLAMLLKPLSVFADVVPMFGNIVQTGTGIIAFVFAFFFSLMVIGVAWIFYRPVLGISLMAAAVALVGWMVVRRKRKAKRGAPPVPPIQRAHGELPSGSFSPATGAAAKRPPATPPVPPSAPSPPPLSTASPLSSPASEAVDLTAEDWVSTGKVAYSEGRLDAAAEAFEKAITLDPGHGNAFYNLGIVRNKAGDAIGAVESFKQAARLGYQRAMDLLSARNIEW